MQRKGQQGGTVNANLEFVSLTTYWALNIFPLDQNLWKYSLRSDYSSACPFVSCKVFVCIRHLFFPVWFWNSCLLCFVFNLISFLSCYLYSVHLCPAVFTSLIYSGVTCAVFVTLCVFAACAFTAWIARFLCGLFWVLYFSTSLNKLCVFSLFCFLKNLQSGPLPANPWQLH